MSYIRTKDTIFKVIAETDLVYLVVAKNKKNHYAKSKRQTLVIKQGEHIEDVCDEFVFRVENNGYLLINDFKKTLEIVKTGKDIEFECYGAIWTNKGLIYVAKMNDKGELELL